MKNDTVKLTKVNVAQDGLLTITYVDHLGCEVVTNAQIGTTGVLKDIQDFRFLMVSLRLIPDTLEVGK